MSFETKSLCPSFTLFLRRSDQWTRPYVSKHSALAKFFKWERQLQSLRGPTCSVRLTTRTTTNVHGRVSRRARISGLAHRHMCGWLNWVWSMECFPFHKIGRHAKLDVSEKRLHNKFEVWPYSSYLIAEIAYSGKTSFHPDFFHNILQECVVLTILGVTELKKYWCSVKVLIEIKLALSSCLKNTKI